MAVHPQLSNRPLFLRSLFLLPLFALGACQSASMSARAPSSSLAPAGTTLAFVGVQGPDAQTAKKFEAILGEEAKRHGYALGVGGMQVKTYLDGYVAQGGKTGFSWVLDASGDGRTRLARTRGTAMLGAASASPWSALDEPAMRQIARMSLDDLTRQMKGADAAPAAEAGTAEAAGEE